MRVTLNGQRYWRAGDSVTQSANGYGTPLEPVGDKALAIRARRAHSMRKRRTSMFRSSSHGCRSSQTQDACEGRDPQSASGERSASARGPRDRSELRVCDLRRLWEGRVADAVQSPAAEEQPDLRRRLSFLYSAWVTKPNSEVANNEPVTVHPDSINSDGTGVVILVSKSDTAPSKGGTLTDICTQPPSTLVACYAGTGTTSTGPPQARV